VEVELRRVEGGEDRRVESAHLGLAHRLRGVAVQRYALVVEVEVAARSPAFQLAWAADSAS
jgi:hypothetical protein